MTHQYTERPCGNCEDGHYIKLASRELVCPDCSYTPRGSFTGRNYVEPWEEFRRGQDRAADDGRRVRMVGGFHDAYIGDGEYEYSYDEMSFHSP